MTTPGNTPAVRLCDWERNLDFSGVWVKDESKNPTGTFKDRRSAYIVQQAIDEKVDKIVLISMGNAAYSLAHYAKGTGIEVSVVVDQNLTKSIREKLHEVCDSVTEVDLHSNLIRSHELKELVRSRSEENILDATNSYHESYREIVRELKRDLPVQPDCIFMPFGAGEAMTGVIRGVEEVGWKIGTVVYGINNESSERLKTNFHHTSYLDCFKYDSLPFRLVMGVNSRLSPEQVQEMCVPAGITSEDAAANVFYYVIAARNKLPAITPNRNIVMINSGSGKVLEE